MNSKKIFLIRHSYAENGLGKQDFDRVLTQRGQLTVHTLSKKLRKDLFQPQLIFCSPSARTRETLVILSENLNLPQENIELKKEIYNASIEDLVLLLQTVNEDISSLAMVGHNPSLSFFVSFLTQKNTIDMKPGGIVSLSMRNMKWKNLREGNGEFLSYFHPNTADV